MAAWSRTPQGDRAPRRLDDVTTRAILETTRNAAPTGGDHWTTRALAKVLGVSNATVARVWKAHGITPKKKKGPETTGTRTAAQRSSTLLGAYVSLPLKGFVVSIDPDTPRPTDTAGQPGRSGSSWAATPGRKSHVHQLCV